MTSEMDLHKFFIEFQDYLAPKLDTYEQAIYLYVFRHTRLLGRDEAVIGFKSARARLALGVGQKGRPMSEHSAYSKVDSLEAKGFIEVVGSERLGRRLRLRLPGEIPGIVLAQRGIPEISLDIETMDFFEVAENRILILERDGNQCFYCLRQLNKDSYVLEHVISRPSGGNSYRNLVAACRECNNRKNDRTVEDFLRTLYRESILSAKELEARLTNLERLKRGELRPVLAG